MYLGTATVRPARRFWTGSSSDSGITIFESHRIFKIVFSLWFSVAKVTQEPHVRPSDSKTSWQDESQSMSLSLKAKPLNNFLPASYGGLIMLIKCSDK